MDLEPQGLRGRRCWHHPDVERGPKHAPLAGGTSPTTDEGSPITLAGGNTGSTVQVVMSEEGTFPYFCDKHPNSLQGVIYVSGGG